MRKTFYQYLMTLKDTKIPTETSQLAESASRDLQFPKQSEDYHEISDYLELNTDYLENLTLFDQLWEVYLEENN